jgi:acetyltransferase-like isoleucine patch superfamily enzyme
VLESATQISGSSYKKSNMQNSPNKQGPFEDPLNLFFQAFTKLYSLWVSATYPFASNGHNLSIHPTALLTRRVAPGIKLGNSVIIRNNAWLNTFGLSEADQEAKIIIDDHCVINAQCVISSKNTIHLERDIMVSACALIMDHNHAYEDISAPIKAQGLTPGGTIRIEQGCWIGHGAAIVCSQGELVIGRNSVVAANALVTKSFPPYSVIVGNPARLARRFDAAKGIWVGGPTHPAVGEHLS